MKWAAALAENKGSSPCSNFQFLTTFNTPSEIKVDIYPKKHVKTINGLYIALSRSIFFLKN